MRSPQTPFHMLVILAKLTAEHCGKRLSTISYSEHSSLIDITRQLYLELFALGFRSGLRAIETIKEQIRCSELDIVNNLFLQCSTVNFAAVLEADLSVYSML